MAEGILKSKLKLNNLEWEVDSAGTSGWHIGELPDRRGMQLLETKGIDISGQRSRQFVKEDFDRFDLILAMDAENYQNIIKLTLDEKAKDKVQMILNYLEPKQNKSVPDPYYNDGFTLVFDLLDQACEQIILNFRN